MRLRRAVPKIPAKFSVPARLPLHKNRSVKTPSKSTLPQLLIPLHFKSPIYNVYKKPQGEGPISSPRVLQLVTTPSPLRISVSLHRYVVTSLLLTVLRTRRNPCNPFPFMGLLHNLRTPRGWGCIPQSSLRHLRALCVSALSFSFSPFDFPHSFIPSEAEGPASAIPYLVTSLFHYFAVPRLTQFVPPPEYS
jgi:hypothetical protein